MAFITLSGVESWLIIAIGAIYLVGVQGITISIHLPLNNHLQRLDIDDLDAASLRDERVMFESRWVYFNRIRTAIAFSVSLILLIIIAMR
ncbi:MAG: anthrone oxygenase family protein [Candidatus Puniceispirillum sp.]